MSSSHRLFEFSVLSKRHWSNIKYLGNDTVKVGHNFYPNKVNCVKPNISALIFFFLWSRHRILHFSHSLAQKMSATASVAPQIARGKGKRSREEYAKRFTKKFLFYMCTWHHIEIPFNLATFNKKANKGIGVKAFVYQTEIAPSTGKKHFQAYIEFIKRVSIKQIFEAMDLPFNNNPDEEGAYFEPRRGTHEQAYAYCTKLETRENATAEPITYGTFSTTPDGA